MSEARTGALAPPAVTIIGGSDGTNARALKVGTDGSLSSGSPTSATATETSVASSASNVTLLASNTSRKGFAIYNDSTAILYVKFGATASSTSYTVQMAAGSYYESGPVVYSGKIDGIWASAAGNARVTELT